MIGLGPCDESPKMKQIVYFCFEMFESSVFALWKFVKFDFLSDEPFDVLLVLQILDHFEKFVLLRRHRHILLF